MNKEKIILIGGGGHCKSCIDIIEQENHFEIAGILDKPSKVGQEVLGYKIIGSDDNLPELVNIYENFLITVGQLSLPDVRIKLFGQVKNLGGKFPTIISPHAYVSKHSKIGEGTIVMHRVLINANAKVGINCIVNSQTLIEHDAVIGNHCHISTAAVINGGVIVGNGTFFGSGAVSKQYSIIPENSFIKANTTVK